MNNELKVNVTLVELVFSIKDGLPERTRTRVGAVGDDEGGSLGGCKDQKKQ